MKKQVDHTRRSFLQESAKVSTLVTIPWIIPGSVLGKNGSTAASDRITLGVIGIGRRCKRVLKGMMTHKELQCLAIADVQAQKRQEGKAMVDEHHQNNDCKEYRDFRALLHRSDIDAVLVATGDRWHAPASILAARAGKDVYSEKPCGITIGDCQRLADTMDTTNRIFQAGTQRRSVANFIYAVRLAQQGKLGKIHTLNASVYVPKLKNDWLPAQPTPDPEQVDWNLWLGPAPWRPFNKDYVDGKWREYYDFDSGATLLDWGAHTVDLCQWAGGKDHTMPSVYEPGEKNITAIYDDGLKLIMHFLETPFAERPGWTQDLGTCPVRFEGEEGWVEVGDSGGIQFSSEELMNSLTDIPAKESGLGVKNHSRNFFDCIRSREVPVANQLVMRHSHITCHAAALSWILNRKLTLEPEKERFKNDDEANGLMNRPARNWES